MDYDHNFYLPEDPIDYSKFFSFKNLRGNIKKEEELNCSENQE